MLDMRISPVIKLSRSGFSIPGIAALGIAALGIAALGGAAHPLQSRKAGVIP